MPIFVIFGYGHNFQPIDVVFDQYHELTIKERTRARRNRGNPIQRVIENPDVPLSQYWEWFLSDLGNKADFLKDAIWSLVDKAPSNTCVVTSGGLDEPTTVF